MGVLAKITRPETEVGTAERVGRVNPMAGDRQPAVAHIDSIDPEPGGWKPQVPQRHGDRVGLFAPRAR